MKLSDSSAAAFLDALSSDAPAPGGGAAAALVGALGAALTMMVGNLTVGKRGFEDRRDALLRALEKGELLKSQFSLLAVRDTETFNALMSAYALPKNTDGQKTARHTAIQNALRGCTEVSLSMLRLGSEGIDLLGTMVGTTNPNLVSDLGIAGYLLKAAIESAWLNVLINLASLEDKSFAGVCRREGEALLAHALPAADEACERVRSILETEN